MQSYLSYQAIIYLRKLVLWNTPMALGGNKKGL